MPRRNYLQCCGVVLLFSASLNVNAQPAPDLSQQRLINYQLQQQKIWQNKQLPVNSVLYRNTVKYPAPELQFKRKSIHSSGIHSPAIYSPATQSSPIRLPIYVTKQETSYSDLFLKNQLLNVKMKNIQWEKYRWLKDPNLGIGAELMRSILAPTSFQPLKN